MSRSCCGNVAEASREKFCQICFQKCREILGEALQKTRFYPCRRIFKGKPECRGNVAECRGVSRKRHGGKNQFLMVLATFELFLGVVVIFVVCFGAFELSGASRRVLCIGLFARQIALWQRSGFGGGVPVKHQRCTHCQTQVPLWQDPENGQIKQRRGKTPKRTD